MRDVTFAYNCVLLLMKGATKVLFIPYFEKSLL